MNLTPPISQYISGSTSTHTSLKGLADRLGTELGELTKHMQQQGYLSAQGKATTRAADVGLLDTCEGKLLWRVSKARELLSPTKKTTSQKPPTAPVRTEPAWVDLDTIGTYFGVGKLQVGKWLDQLGMRALPKLETNPDGSHDMLAVARQEQQRQSAGFIGKEPTEKALELGVAQVITVTGKKDKTFDIVKWNLDLCKALLVKAGHPLDTEHKGTLKGKGKNSNVAVNGMDQRAHELYVKWARLYSDPKTRWQCGKLFRGQPKPLLERVEALMKMPGYLTEGRYLSDK